MTRDERCDDKPWGFLATNVPDPPNCITECRQRFLASLSLQDETLQRVCSVLSDTSHGKVQDEPIFWSLYCCDAQLCGVDNLESGGDDPNINWFINSCQNIGYSSVTDPGPPESTYSCSHVSLYGGDPRCQKHKVESRTAGESSTTALSGASSQTSMATATYSSIKDPSLEASLDPSAEPKNATVQSPQGLSTPVKATIALSVIVGILLIVLAIYCIVRRKPRAFETISLRRYLPNNKSKALPPLPTDSPTPLFSPTTSHYPQNTVPLTPPPPLKNRRLLDVSGGSRPSSAGGPRTLTGIPKAPFFAPSANKPLPRPERTPWANYQTISPPQSPRGWAATHGGSMRSLSSNPNSVVTSNTWTSTSATTVPSRAALSISRAFDIPGLASPGPPPTRALPSTPPNGTITPSIASSSAPASPRRHGDIGVALGVVNQNPADGVVLNQEARELCELTEACTRESRNNSWGSWRGSGGGVSMSLRKGREITNPPLDEIDLERLAGRY